MSRLDLLKTGSTAKKKTSDKSPRGGMLDDKPQKSKERLDDLSEEVLTDDDFENELETPITQENYEYDDHEDSDTEDEGSVNVIEIDLEESGIDIDLGDDEASDQNDVSATEEVSEEPAETSEIVNEIPTVEDQDLASDIVEGHAGVDYSEEDIKLEVDYVFEHRDEVYDLHVRAIKDGGMEIATSKVLQLEDIVRISVTLTELKEQVGCEARVVSVFPRNIRAGHDESEKQFRYIVQFIGPNATETERVVSKYLLGYKPKE